MTANVVIQQMLYLQYENRNQEIHFYINSPGGSVTATLAIYDTMQFLECPDRHLLHGHGGQRGGHPAGGRHQGQALRPAALQGHDPPALGPGHGGQASDVEIEMKEILKEKRRLNEILAKHTGRPLEQIEAETERNRYFTARRPRSSAWSMRCSSRCSDEKKTT